MTIERRTANEGVELREEGDYLTAIGYAATFNRLSSNLGGFVERVAPGDSAVLADVDFSRANLERVDLSQSILDRSSFSGATLRATNLYATYGTKESVVNADLSAAILYGTDFSIWEVTGANADRETVWPDGFDPKAAGVTFRK